MTDVSEGMDNLRENTSQTLNQNASLRNPYPHFARLGSEIGKEVYLFYGREEDGTLDTQAQEEYSKIIAIACASFFMGNGLMIMVMGFSAIFQYIIPGSVMPFFTYGAHGTLLVLLGSGLMAIKRIVPKKHKNSIYESEYTAIVHTGLFVLVIGSLLLIFSSLPGDSLYGVVPLTILFGGLWLAAEAWLIGAFDEEVDWRARILRPIKHRGTVKNATKNLLSRELITICLGIGVVATTIAAFLDALIYKVSGATGLPNGQLNAAFPLIDHIFGLPPFIQMGGIAIGAISCLYLYGATMIWMGSGDSLMNTLYQVSSVVKVACSLVIYYILNTVFTGALILCLPIMISSELTWSFVITPVLLVGALYVYIPIFLYPYFVARQPDLLAGFKTAWNTLKKNRITSFVLIYNSAMAFLMATLVFLLLSMLLYTIVIYIMPTRWDILWTQSFIIVIVLLLGQMFQVAMITDGVRQLCGEDNTHQ